MASERPGQAEQETEHGVGEAFYDTFRDPTLVCLCGHQASGSTWEEAGADLDTHLKEEEG